jgi:hypothetical protein
MNTALNQEGMGPGRILAVVVPQLDLWGLASLEALNARRSHGDSSWMVPLGELRMAGMRVTPAFGAVDFHAVVPEAAPELVETLRRFERTLPDGASFVFPEAR